MASASSTSHLWLIAPGPAACVATPYSREGAELHARALDGAAVLVLELTELLLELGELQLVFPVECLEAQHVLDGDEDGGGLTSGFATHYWINGLEYCMRRTP